jgi:hypothetical protein
MFWAVVLLFPFLLFTWALVRPDAVLALIAEAKRQLRLHVIRRERVTAAAQFAARLRAWGAERGIEKELVEEAITTQRHAVVERIGRRYADTILGEPTPVERYH